MYGASQMPGIGWYVSSRGVFFRYTSNFKLPSSNLWIRVPKKDIEPPSLWVNFRLPEGSTVLRFAVNFYTLPLIVISKMSSTSRALVMTLYSRSSTHRLATMGETGLSIVVSNNQATLILSGVLCTTNHKFTVMNVTTHAHFMYIAGCWRENGWQTLLINGWNSPVISILWKSETVELKIIKIEI